MGDPKGFEDESVDAAGDGNWQTTEQLLKTLNRELGGLKEYVLTELRGEITALRSEKVQLQSQVQELRHQREALLNEIRSNHVRLDPAQQLHASALPLQDEQQPSPSQLAEARFDSIELPNDQGLDRVPLMEMPDLDWREPGLAEDAVEGAIGSSTEISSSDRSIRDNEVSDEARSAANPTDVASVLSSMPDLRPPATAAPNSQAAAMPRPPRLTQPVPANAFSATDIAQDPELLADDDGGDESFIADFPINVVRPDISGFPAAQGDAGLKDSPVNDLDTASATRIAMPPGMVDRVGEAAAAPQGRPQPTQPTQPVSPWLGEPPTRISSLIELTDRGAGVLLSDARPNPGAIAPPPSLEFLGLPSLSEQPEIAGSGDSLPLETESDRTPRAQLQQKSRQKGAAIALVALLLAALQYATVQVLFHGVPWIAAGQGFIAASWSNALVTFWIRMLMLLPFMIVIGQGLYPPLLSEAQAVFRDRDPIPLVSIGLSGLFFFLAHFLLYGAIAMNSATPAVALFFLYPVLGQLLGWGLFNQRLGPTRLLAMLPMVLGVVLLLVQWGAASGSVAGLASALFYALFLMLTAVNGRRMHPLTLTVLQFGLAWIWAVPAVFFLPQAMPLNHLGYVMACALLSVTVGVGQLFGLASRRRLGAGLSAMLQGVLPLAVGVFCLLTDEILPIGQVFAVLLVSGGAIALGFQRLSRDGA